MEKSERTSGLGGLLRRRKVKVEEEGAGKKAGEGKEGGEGKKKEEDAEPFALKDVNLVVKRCEYAPGPCPAPVACWRCPLLDSRAPSYPAHSLHPDCGYGPDSPSCFLHPAPRAMPSSGVL